MNTSPQEPDPDPEVELASTEPPRRRVRWLPTVLKLALVIGILGYLFTSKGLQISNLKTLIHRWQWVALSALTFLPLFVIVALRYYLVLRAAGLPATVKQAFAWTMIGSFFDIAAPLSSGGDLVKAWYAAQTAGKGKRALAFLATFADRVIGLFALFLFALIVCVFGGDALKSHRNLENLTNWLLILCTLGVGGAVLSVSSYVRNSTWRKALILKLPGGEKLENLYQSLAGLGKKPWMALGIILLSLANHAVSSASLLFLAEGIDFTHVETHMPMEIDTVPALAVLPLCMFFNTFGFAGGFGAGEVAFQQLFALTLQVREGAELAFAYHVMAILLRLLGIPFWLAYRHPEPAVSAPAEKVPALETAGST